MSEATLTLDSSRPYQVEGPLIAFWLPRGRERDSRPRGLAGRVDFCANETCPCTEGALTLAPVDDSHVEVVWTRRGFELKAPPRDGPAAARPPAPPAVSIDFVTGVVRESSGKPLDAQWSPFFEAPIPGWVLDDLFEEWASHRPPLAVSWLEQALEDWSLGELAPWSLLYPDRRWDQYIIDGRRYLIDFAFPADPADPAEDGVIDVLEATGEPESLSFDGVGHAHVSVSTGTPSNFHGPLGSATFGRLFVAWRDRNGPAAEAVARIRGEVRARGAELHAAALARARRAPPSAVTPLKRPQQAVGRNERCPCGSGSKYKRCCGA